MSDAVSNPASETPEVEATADPATDAADTATEAAATEAPAAEAPADEVEVDVVEPAEVIEPVVTDEAPEIVPAVTVHVAVDRPVQTVGRRKEAIVRVRLMPGTGQFTLNGRTLDGYFPNKVHQQLVKEPFVNLEKDGIYDVFASLSGGGVTGQAGALRLGIARALIELEPTDRPPLKKAGFLKRDPRVKERKKYGLKKARKAPQYSKR
ncbi:30S ribosomal protein S9 [Nakamurella lactea]|uniref:30S ribosomal protein S9 n=1 Tax=Nakamurella lactea TaxID=459515 RepID=UPI000A01C187